MQTPKNIGRSPTHSSAETLGRHEQGDGSYPGSVNAEVQHAGLGRREGGMHGPAWRQSRIWKSRRARRRW